MPDVTVDRETLRALGADTRIEILKCLAKRQMTQAELAATLGISEPSVDKHLEKLEQAGLVFQMESDGRKWKYFALTQKGTAIIAPSVSRKIFLLLGMLLLGLTVFFFLSNKPTQSYIPQLFEKSFSDIRQQIGVEASKPEKAVVATPTPSPVAEEQPPSPPVYEENSDTPPSPPENSYGDSSAIPQPPSGDSETPPLPGG